jgi:hypothetical protein
VRENRGGWAVGTTRTSGAGGSGGGRVAPVLWDSTVGDKDSIVWLAQTRNPATRGYNIRVDERGCRKKKWGAGFGRGLADPATPAPLFGGVLGTDG